MAISEAIAMGKRNRAVVHPLITKCMKVADRKRIEVVYDAAFGKMPSKPYAREEAVQLELEAIAFTERCSRIKSPPTSWTAASSPSSTAKGFSHRSSDE